MRKKIFATIIPLHFLIATFAQSPADVFKHHTDSFPAEHIYLQFDKQAYVAGEIAWFKGYVLSSFSLNSPSTDFYLDVLNDHDSLIVSKKIPIIEGTATGSIDLPFNLKQGLYFVRGYTRWLMNDDQSFIFKKAIPVFNPDNKYTPPVAVKSSLSFELFPENNHVIAGVPNNIAFKAYDDQLQEVKISGHLENQDKKNLGDFANGIFGSGSFSFTPVKDEKYFASVQFPGQPAKSFELPQAIDNGATLTLADHELGKIFSAILSPSLAKQMEEISLLAVMDNHIVLETKVKLKDNEALGVINTKDLQPGILRVLVFDNNNNLLAQRSSFISNFKLTEGLEMKLKKIDLSPKAKNEFSFVFPENIDGSFSVSVTDADRELLSKNRQDIFTGLLVQPGTAKFINNHNIGDVEATDILMMTNTWYGDNWAEFAKKKKPVYGRESFITLQGKVYEQGTNKLISNATMNVVVIGKQGTQKNYEAKIAKDGSFVLDHLVYEDSARIYYGIEQTNSQRTPPVAEIVLDKEEEWTGEQFIRKIDFTQYAKAMQAVFDKPETMSLAAELRKMVAPSQPITAVKNDVPDKSAKKKDTETRYATGLFKSPNSKSFDFIKEPPPAGLTIIDFLTGKLGSGTIERVSSNRYNIWSNRSIEVNQVMRGSVNSRGVVYGKFYLNELESTSDAIATIPSSQYALAKYYEPGTLMLPNIGIGCVLAFWTKKPEDITTNDFSNMNNFMYPGYSVNRVFSSPDYSADNKNITDNRTTLYWNPSVKITGDKEFSIQFYNSDQAKRLHIVLEGVTADGRVVRFEKIIPSTSF